MNIVITGGSGFLGGWIANLLSLSHRVVLIGRPTSNFWRILPNRKVDIILKDAEQWASIVNSYDPDCLILNDWQGVENTHRNSHLQIENVVRLKKLLSDIECNPKIIGVGSQAELGPCSGTILESQGDNPTTLYGKAKVDARNVLFNSEVGQIDSYWARIFSTYGNTDNGGWFLPSLISKLGSGETFPMTLGEQEWSYLHALDLAFAFKYIVENDLPSRIVNVGNPNTVLIRDVATEVGRRMDAEGFIEFGAIPYRDDQVMQLKPICETLVQSGWNPKVELTDGIDSLISEFKTNTFDLDKFIKNYM